MGILAHNQYQHIDDASVARGGREVDRREVVQLHPLRVQPAVRLPQGEGGGVRV